MVTMKSLEVWLNMQRWAFPSLLFPTNNRLSHSRTVTPKISHECPRPYLWRDALKLGLWFPKCQVDNTCLSVTGILYNRQLSVTQQQYPYSTKGPRSGCHQGCHLLQTLSLPCIASSSHNLPSVCVLISPKEAFLKGPPTPTTSFNFNFLFKHLSPNTIMSRHWELGLQHMNFGEAQLSL